MSQANPVKNSTHVNTNIHVNLNMHVNVYCIMYKHIHIHIRHVGKTNGKEATVNRALDGSTYPG